VLTYAGDLWQRAFDSVALEHPGVATAYNHVDAACIFVVENSARYDVVVTDNLFGDILADLAGAVTGGIGLAAVGQPQPCAHRAVPLRAGSRLRARHRRHRAGKSTRGNPLRGDDVGAPRPGGRSRSSHQGSIGVAN